MSFTLEMVEDFKNNTKRQEKTNLPWTEKFRPKIISDVISNQNIVEAINGYIHRKNFPHLLFCGPSGTGKTSLIIAAAKQLYGNYFNIMTIHINASEERGIEVIRNKVKHFSSAMNFTCKDIPFKLVILDEADAMTTTAQAMLRRMIEDYTSSVRFCLICNKLKNIDPAIQSRCTNFRFSPLDDSDVYNHLVKLCNNENIYYEKSGLKMLIKISNGDMRKVFNNLQSVFMGYGKITEHSVSSSTNYPTSNDIEKIYETANKTSLNDALETISEIINSNQYSMLDIINEVHDRVKNDFMNDNISFDKFQSVLSKLKLVEMNTLITISNELLIASFVASFY